MSTEQDDSEFQHSNTERVRVESIKLKDGLSYEGLVAQVQKGTKKVLCVEDGATLRIYNESGPFPLGVRFEHKQRRYGMTEYFFRYAKDTQEESAMCVFGRDNAEVFCPDYVDDQETESESTSENATGEEDLLSTEVFSTSEDEGEVLSPLEPEESADEDPSQLSEGKSPKENAPDAIQIQEEGGGTKVPSEAPDPHIQVIEIEPKREEEDDLREATYDLS